MRGSLIAILLGFLLPCTSLIAVEEVPIFSLMQSMDGVSVNRSMLLYAGTRESYEKVADKPYAWNRMEKENLPFSFTDQTFWVKFSVRSPKQENPISWYFLLNNPGMEELVLYKKVRIENSESWVEIGQDVRTSFLHPSFLIETPSDTQEDFLIRASSRRSVILNFQVWTPKEFLTRVQYENILLGLYFGAIGIMLIYNGFLAFVVKDSSYFYYVFYLLFYALWQLAVSGVGAQYLTESTPQSWNDYLVGFAFLSVCFSLLFTRSFLHMEREAANWKNQAFLYLSGFAFIGFCVSLFPSAYSAMMRAVSWYPFISAILVVYASVTRLKKGFRPARYFLLAWSVLIVSVLVTSLRNLSIIPDSFMVHWSAQIGSGIEMTLLSFALADRIKTLEKDSLQARLENYDNLLRLTEIEGELKVARELQESILPETLPEVPNLKLSVRSEFASSVGGDFYDFYAVGKGKLGIFLSDVSGHGIPAAIIASMVKLAFSIEVRNHEDPAEVLRNINRALNGKYGKHYITAAYVLVDGETGRVSYSNAGHPPLVIVRRVSGETREIFLPGWIIGMDPNLKNSVAEFYLEPGDRLVVYTDGVTEARSPKGEIFGFQKFYKLLGENISLPGEMLAEIVFQTLREFTGNRKHFEDDLTMVVLDFQPAPEMNPQASLLGVTSGFSGKQ
ncbi:serine/threonine protein phosphatase [Leptospira perolatii]|uniref:Serine/threonine protein phosphatase n=1 Tax=Leptospira perolatii TaxID=2023191 RepID=A0A2M9ZLS4_9LEPT|nr:7TM diverse intracellular signaling domain-containing protein [Leptospira perolatii]PJZ69798.1 serine/threonine protein phosphatase [Leptospira perolatii]PJZ72987.1 serine/threonine protein phosphatase [Leptospira perolatii]